MVYSFHRLSSTAFQLPRFIHHFLPMFHPSLSPNVLGVFTSIKSLCAFRKRGKPGKLKVKIMPFIEIYNQLYN